MFGNHKHEKKIKAIRDFDSRVSTNCVFDRYQPGVWAGAGYGLCSFLWAWDSHGYLDDRVHDPQLVEANLW